MSSGRNNFTNVYFHRHLYLCARCNRYRNRTQRNVSFLFGKMHTIQWDASRDGANAKRIHLRISLICLRKRSTFYRIDRTYIYETSKSTDISVRSNKIIPQFKLLRIDRIKFSFKWIIFRPNSRGSRSIKKSLNVEEISIPNSKKRGETTALHRKNGTEKSANGDIESLSVREKLCSRLENAHVEMFNNILHMHRAWIDYRCQLLSP